MKEAGIRVLVVDDHSLVRDGICRLLEAEPDLLVVGAVSSGPEALGSLPGLRPDVILLDIRMPGMSGIEATRAIRAADPLVRVVALSAYDDQAAAAYEAGVSGYVLKTARSAELLATLRAVHLGTTVIPDSLGGRLGLALRGPGPSAGGLTPREREVLALVVRGLTNRAIARALDIGPRTADQHVHSIFLKAGVRSRAEAVHYALENHLVGGEAPA